MAPGMAFSPKSGLDWPPGATATFTVTVLDRPPASLSSVFPFMTPPPPPGRASKKRKKPLSAAPSSSEGGTDKGGHGRPGRRTTLWAAHTPTGAVEEGRGAVSVRSADRRGAKACLHAVPSVLQPGLKSPWQVCRQGVMKSGAWAVALELQRAVLAVRLRKLLAKLCAELGVATVPLLAFERWRFSCKWQEDMLQHSCSGTGSTGKAEASNGKKVKGKGQQQQPLTDPLLPSSSSCHDNQQLCDDLQRAGVSAEDAMLAAARLATASTAAVKELHTLAHKLRSGREVSGVEVQVIEHKHSISLTCGGHVIKLTHEAWQKLQTLAAHFSPVASAAAEAAQEDGSKDPQAELKLRNDVEQRTFALVLRYKTMQGAGFQAAAGPAVFELLRRRMEVEFEMFASPLNCYYGNFCSAFPDVDGPFGSRGSFFGFSPTKGCFQANPPFVHCIIDGMAERILSLLQSAEGAEVSLAFVVFLPGWEESRGWNLLKGSSLNRRLVLVAAKDHGFCDGSSHQSQDPFRRSPYDTGVFFLQTDKATRRWPVTDVLEEELRCAMAECMPSAAAEERQSKGRKKNRKVSGGAVPLS